MKKQTIFTLHIWTALQQSDAHLGVALDSQGLSWQWDVSTYVGAPVEGVDLIASPPSFPASLPFLLLASGPRFRWGWAGTFILMHFH